MFEQPGEDLLHMYSLFASHQVAEVCLARKHKTFYVFCAKLIHFSNKRVVCGLQKWTKTFIWKWITHKHTYIASMTSYIVTDIIWCTFLDECAHFSLFFFSQNLDIQVEDVRIRAILSSYRKRIPVTEGYVEVKDGGKWKQICNTEWSDLNSRVICGMFGFPGERKYNARVYKWVHHYCMCGPGKLKGQR